MTKNFFRTKALITAWFLFQCGAVLYGAKLSECREVKKLSQVNEAWIRDEALNRVARHAKELMGSKYTVPAVGTPQADLKGAIQEWTRRALKSDDVVADRVAVAILEQSQLHGIDPAFLMAVIQRESRFNPLARGSHGEIGLMQLQPPTAAWIAAKFKLPFQGADTLKDPVANVRIGAAYFAFLRNRFKSRGELYLAAYNMGPRKMREFINSDVMPRQYASDVLHNYVQIHTELNELL